MKLQLNYFFLFLFPMILVLPLPLIVSSVALALALLNILIISFYNGQWKTISSKNLLIVFGAIVFSIDSITSVLRDFNFELIIRDVRIAFLIVPIILCSIKEQLKFFLPYLLASLVLGVILYILFAYGYMTYFYTSILTNRDFALNHYLIYDLRENLPGAYHHSYIGSYMTFSIAILLRYAIKEQKWFFLSLASFILVNQVVFGSKLTFAFSFFVFLFYTGNAIMKHTISRIKLLCLVSFIVIAAVCLTYQSDMMGSIFFSTSNRIESWQCAFKGFLDKPFLGHGHNASVIYLENCINSKAISTHNQYLEELINYGVFGIWLPVLFIILFFKSKRDSLFFTFLLLIVTICLFENALSLQRGVLFFVFFVSIFITVHNADKLGKTSN